ncbi:MAG: methionyl-tRNA formyltransferase [Candidatus Saccharimonadales bacterium]
MSKPIVFFGSGPVAAAALVLLAKNFTIEAIISKPKPLHHHGAAPVLEVATELNIPVFTPQNKTELTNLFRTRPVTSTVGVVIDYGIIISQEVIDYFPYGIVNSHFSLLPELRGADPISFAILQNKKETGVSIMLINAALDEGMLLAQSTYVLSQSMTAPELTHDLILLSHALLVDTLPNYIDGSITPYEQDLLTPATYSRKLTKSDGQIDWHKSATILDCEIRAFCEWPKSHTLIGDKEVVITRAHPTSMIGKIGTVTVANNELIAFCGQGALIIDKLKPAGKNEMTGKEFIQGYRSKI